MVKYKTESLVCPKCNRRPVFGYRWFGPAQVRCGYCDTLLTTSLKDWDSFDKNEKINLTIKEILDPSWFGVKGLTGYILYIFLMLPLEYVLIGTPIFLISLAVFMIIAGIGGAINISIITSVVVGIATLLLMAGILLSLIMVPALNVWRLRKMIKESKQFKIDNKPPVWKKII